MYILGYFIFCCQKMDVSAISRGGGIHLPPCTGGDLDPVANRVKFRDNLSMAIVQGDSTKSVEEGYK